MLENMKNRRTIRKYTTQDIPDALLNELLEVAARASNTGNMQLYSVVITRDKANKEKLAPAHFNQPMITAAPVVLTFCADANRFVKWAELRDAVPVSIISRLLSLRLSMRCCLPKVSVRQQRKKDWESAIWERRLITQIRLSMPCRFHAWLSLS